MQQRGLGENVIFHGFTAQDKLDELYRQADIFALPSFAEGVPGVLMEAMAMEIPCVATWITGIPELIRNGVDGLLVAPSDVEAFAGAIRQLIARFPICGVESVRRDELRCSTSSTCEKIARRWPKCFAARPPP